MLFKLDSYWIKSGAYTLLEKCCAMLFGFGSFLLLIRLFSKDDFGTWTLFVSITTLIELARNGLVQNAQIKFLASEPAAEHPGIITASALLNIIYTAINILVLLALAPFLSRLWDAPVLQQMYYWYLLTSVILVPFSQFSFIQQAHMQFKGVFYSSLVRYGLFFAVILVAYQGNGRLTLEQLVMYQILTTLAGTIVGYLFARQYLVFSRKVDYYWLKKQFHYGKYVFGTNISSVVYKSLDQLFLGTMISTAAVAVYNAAIRITNLVELPTAPLSTIIFPKSAQRSKSEGEGAAKYLYERSVGLILALLVPFILVVVLFPKPIILLVAGEQYLDSVRVLQVTILYAFFIPFARQFGTALDSVGKPQVNFYFVAAGACINAVLNYFFISRYGLIGAAYGTFCSYALCFVMYQVVIAKTLKVKLVNTFLYARDFYVDGYWFSRKCIDYIKIKLQ